MATPAEVNLDSVELRRRVERFQTVRDNILAQVRQVIVGQDEVLDQILIALFVGGHCLITGLARHGQDADGAHDFPDAGPGFQAHSVHAGPDALRHHRHGHHRGRSHHRATAAGRSFQGPIFGNILLADEINRTPPKTQSALLEAMQEQSCTVRGNHYKLPSPFFVLATQNPIELEGTYPLPEAQLDRFLFNTVLDYLSADGRSEGRGPDHHHARRGSRAGDQRRGDSGFPEARAHGAHRRLGARYVVDLVRATRHNSGSAPDFVKKYVNYGASVRAAQFIVLAAKARALSRAPLSRRLRRHHCAGHSGAAASHLAEFPRGVGSHRFGRNSAPAARTHAAARQGA